MPPDPPELSCIIPTFESAPLAARCLISIATQAGICPEIVVSDDSRSDAVRDMVRGLATLFPNIRYVEGARTGNPVDNWNHGLDHACGRYRVLVHHDEFYLEPHCLRRAVDRLDREDGRVLLMGHRSVGEDQRSRYGLADRVARRLGYAPWTLYVLNWIGPTAAVVYGGKPDLRFDPRLQWTVDVDFYYRLLDGGVLRDPSASVVSHRHGGQISARVERFGTIEKEIAWLAATYPGRLTRRQTLTLRGITGLRRALSRRSP
jgi:glycosyltransferase involved in cell wall biosynthesis